MNNDIYQQALDSQNACNLSGIIRSLARLTETIWDEARAKGEGTAYVNRHPVVVLFLAQAVYLATGDCLDCQAYGEALAICQAKAKGVDNGN